MSATEKKTFYSLFFLSSIISISSLVIFSILCSNIDMAYSVKSDNASEDYVLGQFGSTGAAILIVGIPLVFILLSNLYVTFLKM
jgi:hypothetical protein